MATERKKCSLWGTCEELAKAQLAAFGDEAGRYTWREVTGRVFSVKIQIRISDMLFFYSNIQSCN